MSSRHPSAARRPEYSRLVAALACRAVRPRTIKGAFAGRGPFTCVWHAGEALPAMGEPPDGSKRRGERTGARMRKGRDRATLGA